MTFRGSPEQGGAAEVDEGAVDQIIGLRGNLRPLKSGAPGLSKAEDFATDLKSEKLLLKALVATQLHDVFSST